MYLVISFNNLCYHNAFFDLYRIGGYFPLSSSLLINSKSRFYDLPQNNFQILGIGQKKDYTLLKNSNNKAYYQIKFIPNPS